MKILLCGCTGAMGQVVTKVAKNEGYEIVAGISVDEGECDYPVYKNLSEVEEEVDVIIDFSVHSAILDILEYAVRESLPLVVATTGHTEEEEKLIKVASEKIAIFKSGNMSLGVSGLVRVTEVLAQILEEFDIEVVEKHHNKKVDAPSGTAKMLVEAAKLEREELKEVYGRNGIVGKRKGNEIGIHSIRGGSIVGEHSVIFAGLDEVVEIKHTALSKAIFAKGAIKAASFIVEKRSGMFCMKDIVQ